MFYIYGAEGSKATDKAENLLIACMQQYKTFIFGKDYSLEQLYKLHPDTKQIPHIYHGFTYIGGVKELYDYLYTVTKFYGEENDN
jgi:hypothetical protein